jgi:hypothetical protein
MLSGLARALSYAGGTHTLDDVADALERGDAQLHESEGAVIITEIQQYPQMRVCHFWLATGELEPVVALSRQVLEWAKEQGCTRATLSGRKGWVKVLASEGWAPMLTLMGREV